MGAFEPPLPNTTTQKHTPYMKSKCCGFNLQNTSSIIINTSP